MLTFTWEDTYDIYIYGITSELIQRAEQMLLINFIVGLIYAKKARVYAPSAIKVALFRRYICPCVSIFARVHILLYRNQF